MKRFIVNALLWISPLLLLLAIGEKMVREVPNSYRQKEEWMEKNHDRVETLILGSSHSLYGVNPAYIEGCAYNLANVSQELEYDWYLLQKFSNGKKLRNVIVTADYDNLFSLPYERDPDNRLRCTYYHLYMGYPKHSTFSQYGFELSVPNNYAGKLKRWIDWKREGHLDTGIDTLGWGTLHQLKDKDLQNWATGKATLAAGSHKCKDTSVIAAHELYLDSIALYCQKHQIKIILLTTPVWTTYVQLLDSRQEQKMNTIINEVCLKYGAQKANKMHDPEFNHANYFYDADHLSEKGAEKLTLELNKLLK